jgi:hypothetical protein
METTLAKRIAKRIDYRVHGLLERVIGEERAAAFAPLNRHPIIFGSGEMHEVVGGAKDGEQHLHLDASKATNAGGSRLFSFLRVMFSPSARQEARQDWRDAQDLDEYLAAVCEECGRTGEEVEAFGNELHYCEYSDGDRLLCDDCAAHEGFSLSVGHTDGDQHA